MSSLVPEWKRGESPTIQEMMELERVMRDQWFACLMTGLFHHKKDR